MKRALALVLMLCLIAACAAFRPRPLEVSLHSLRPLEIGLSEQRFMLLLRVDNPNSRDLVVTGLEYQAEIAGKPFARGVSNRRFVLAAQGETLIELPASVRLSQLVDGLLGRLDALLFGKGAERDIDYRIVGTVTVEAYGALDFARSGKVNPGR